MSNNGKQLAVTRSFGISLTTPRHHLHVARSAATVISMTLALGAASACATKAGPTGHAITVALPSPVLGDERDLHRAMSSPLGLTRVAFNPPPRSVPLRR